MRRSNFLKRATLLAVLGAAALTGGCTDMYLDRRETVSLGAGDAPAHNAMVHMVDPWPYAARNRDLTYDGERMQAAAERYRTGKTTPLTGTSTSSVQYAPVVAPVSK
jgi:hypothetical protein